MNVVFDPEKDDINVRKHGISLQRAAELDLNTACFDVDDSQDYGEVRYNVIGWLNATLYTLTFTQTGEFIRAISLRRASREEKRTYAEEY